ncbi:MAG TPA: RagB/SusD family nutrient uptake outer membrane protein [Segetibacter sp.]|jgi:tetratricopeptide (TPR) repeat protein
MTIKTTKSTLKSLLILGIFAISFGSTSCKKFLDKKSDKTLVVPSTLEDAQALLDFYSLMNNSYPSIGAQSDDDFYLLDTYWAGLGIVNQNNYIWAKDAYNDLEWSNMYQVVLHANLALETTEDIQPTAININDWSRIKGGALFYRAYAFYHIAQYYANPYDRNTSTQTLGIPLRLNTNVNEKTIRSTLQQTYDQIINDLTSASVMLPVTTTPISRPSKAAAFAGLARTYLIMGEYSQARNYADSCLQLNNVLIDYNTINSSTAIPFTRLNPEVIFPSTILTPGMLSVNNWKVDSLLYKSYALNDLRRTIFYQSNGTGTFGFKGSYDGSSSRFNGIATDEVYLIRAECRARLGDKEGALSDLNTLLVKRWKSGTFIPYTASTSEDALGKILIERRKELVLRNIRWFDLRRLNIEPRFAKTLFRNVNGQVHQLSPNDTKYTYYIPQGVISLTGIQQNTRQ